MSRYPQNIDAERGLVSACIQWPETADELGQSGGEDLFYHPAHKTVFRTILDMRRERAEVDPATLISRLRESGQLEAIGGASTVAELAMDLPARSLAAELLRIARKASKGRRIAKLAENALGSIFGPSPDPDEVAQKIDTGLREIMTEISEDHVRPWNRVLLDFLDLTHERIKGDTGTLGLSYGFPVLDSATGGAQDGQLIVIGARPGAGKTAFALQVAQSIAEAGTPVAFFSAEMGAVELATRAVSAGAKIDSLHLQAGEITRGQMEAIARYIAAAGRLPIHIDDRPNMRLIDVSIGARRLKSDHNIGAVFVDYLQLIREEDGSRNREDAVRRLSNGMKNLAKELQIPVFVLAQLNRQGDGSRPKAAHLRDSGSIEQDASTIVLLNPTGRRSGEHETVEAIVAKSRSGKRMDIDFDFHGPTTTFREIGESEPEPKK
jgi:replicative DNA helicase